MLWPFEFLESFRCSITSVSIYYAPESDIWFKSYDNLKISRASVVQFRTSRYIMRRNRTSELKFMTIWISRELALFNYERVYKLCAWIGPPSERYDHLNLSRAAVVKFRASLYLMRQNRTSELNVLSISISGELPLLNYKSLDILCSWIGLPCNRFWPFEYLESFRGSISRVSI